MAGPSPKGLATVGPGIGHNAGPALDPGHRGRTIAWTHARAALLPHLAVEVVRLRVKRAQELGLPYRTYAGIRASTGHDLIGFLFSSNALRVLRDADALPADRTALLSRLRADRVALAQPRVTTAALARLAVIDAAFAAPATTLSWAATRDHLRGVVRLRGPADRFVIVGDTALERDWVAAVGAAGWVAGDAYFAAAG
ncbi:hypothetical protein SAMN04488003_101366 [Loktanella fryxellensis]|uniref:Uncharacterized protein n=1 Tax=Loktanella fryxellensis TaxID=245187 RepID=A0A1H7YZ31_9RHOB|nr:hypothetical protein [Loktanella fryxellensis]SEM50974.1 hypothetical protein SAMN04488003_101366 [Loktanella fryxellensis]